MDTTKNNMDQDKLITLAIHTYTKAEILKTILENEGIPATLANVNQLLPNVSAGVRVKICEKDLLKALDIIEKIDWGKEETFSELNYIDKYKEGKKPFQNEYVLIPVDFSDYTPKIIKLGFFFAHRRNLKVMILHAYFSQYFAVAPMVFGDITGFQAGREMNLKREYEKGEAKMKKLAAEIREMIQKGELPDVHFDMEIKDGAPEDLILNVASAIRPLAIVMGTRGKSKRSDDLIGSVAAEVIDRAKCPVLVVPEDIPIDDLNLVKRVGVATSFDQRDLVLFDRMMHLMQPVSPEYEIFNVSRSEEGWGKLELQAISQYHKHNYPESKISFFKLNDGDFSESLHQFISEKNIDLIVVNTYRRSLFARFFNPGMARRLLFQSGVPLLVMHSMSRR